MSEPMQNTDRELWRETPSYYSPSIHVTEEGRIGINVGGTVFVKPLRDWHALAVAALPEPAPYQFENGAVFKEPGQPAAESEEKICVEADGCPTEKAVLKRFWREHQGQPAAGQIEPQRCKACPVVHGANVGDCDYPDCADKPPSQPERGYSDHIHHWEKHWTEGSAKAFWRCACGAKRTEMPKGVWERGEAEPVAGTLVGDAEYLKIFHNARAGSDKPVGYIRGIRAVIAAYEASTPAEKPRAAVPAAVLNESGWLIEFISGPSPCWMKADFKMTNNSSEAMRFSRKQDAEAFLEIFTDRSDKFTLGKLLDKACYSCTEHIWLAAAPSPDDAGGA
jgi:hypothetical protein